MNKILKILSIFVMVFVLFSCANPSSDSTSGSQPSGPETPVETPSDDPVEETPEEPTYSITFIADTEKEDTAIKTVKTFLNSLPDYKNLKEGEKRELPTIIYLTEEDICTLDPTNCTIQISYEGDITSVVVENEDIKIKIKKVELSEN